MPGRAPTCWVPPTATRGPTTSRAASWSSTRATSSWARLRIDELALEDGLEVVEADAGTSDAYAGAVPADLVLACGVFGNISDADIERTVRSSVAVRPRRLGAVDPPPRVTPLVRAPAGWLQESGLEPIELEVADDETFGVGANRLVVDPPPFEAGEHLFTFTR